MSLLATGCVTTQPELTPTSTASPVQARGAANLVASQEEGRRAGGGGGESMAPVFSENSFLVIAPIAFEELQAGMHVAYRNSRGRQVVHELVRRQGDRWLAIGINNRAIDPDPVTRENLIGVVYGVFHAAAR